MISSSIPFGGLGRSRESSRVSEPEMELAAACARGESSAFEEIYRAHATRMKSVAYHQLGDRAEAEDVVQETFLKIHRNAGGYNGESAFSTWVYRILINTCYDHLRKRGRRPDELSFEGVALAGPHGEDKHHIRLTLRKLLGRLPKMKRDVFLLFEVEGLSHREIAEILDIRESYSKWLLHAAKRALQDMLAEKKEIR